MAQRKDWDWPQQRAVPSERPRNWYVGTAMSGQGLKVVEELHARDYDAYEPRTRAWNRVGRGRRFEVSRPLFGGYLFIGVADGQGFHKLHGIAGLGALLGTGGVPRQIPFEPVDLLRQAETRGEFDFTRKSLITYRPADKIRVVGAHGKASEGYDGLIGEVRRAKGDKRWQVFLDCMSIPLNLDEVEMELLA